MSFIERKKLIAILKFKDFEPWELDEIQQLKELIEKQADKLEIEILIGEKYKNPSNFNKIYDFLISYEYDINVFPIYKEGLTILSNGIENRYKKFPWRVGVVNENINNIYFKSIQNINSKIIIKHYKASSKVYEYSINKTKKSYTYVRACLLMKIILNVEKNIILDTKKNINKIIKYNFIIFYLKYLKNIIKKINYGIFFEKKWNIFIYKNYDNDILKKKIIDKKKCKIPEIKSEYKFYADPFISTKDIFVEALSKKTNLGKIIAIDRDEGFYKYNLDFGKKHFSYPQSIDYQSRKYCLPEMAAHDSPTMYEIDRNNKIIQRIKISGLENIRLLDATHFYSKGLHYIFGGIKGQENQCLNLYYSDNIFGKYYSHPSNPIVMNPDNSRMGGNIIEINGKIYRLGQYNRYGYGEKIKIMEIINISKEVYEEIEKNEIVISQGKGPHTLNVTGNYMVGDFYEEKFSIIAGVNRIIACINS